MGADRVEGSYNWRRSGFQAFGSLNCVHPTFPHKHSQIVVPRQKGSTPMSTIILTVSTIIMFLERLQLRVGMIDEKHNCLSESAAAEATANP